MICMCFALANFAIGLQKHKENLTLIAHFVTFYTLWLWEWLTLFETVKYFNLLKPQTLHTKYYNINAHT